MLEKNDNKKRLAGEKAAEFVKDGMVLGLGSGSTVYWTIKKLGELVQQGMRINGIPSSKRTERWANEFGLPLTDFSEVQELDLAIDGADEIDPLLNLIKGGGGSLLREKLVDTASKEFIVIADESKLVSTLGSFPLPVEVTPFGWEITAKRITQLGGKPNIRMKNNEVFISDNGNYILDCEFGTISSPTALHQQLKLLLGVVETGLFLDMVDKVILGEENGTRVIEKHR